LSISSFIGDTCTREKYFGFQLRKIFKSRPKPLIGLHVCTTSLKWVELAQDDDSRLVLERCVSVPLQAGWMAAGHIEQFDEVAAALRHLVKVSGSNTRDVALAMPDTAVITTKIRLPSDLGEVELLRQVGAEVERLSGRSVADMNFDYSVQGRTQAPGQNAEVDVLIAAASRENVQDWLGLAESAGLTPVVMDVGAEASMLAARRLISAKHVAIANPVVALFQVGTEGASLHVTQQGEIVHVTRPPVDGALLSELIAHEFGLAKTDVETQKGKGSLLDGEQNELSPLIKKLADTLASDLDALLSASSFRMIDTILLAADSPVLSGLQEAINRRTFSDCVLVDPFSGMLMGQTLQGGAFQHAGRAGMLTACGLALRRFHGSC